MPYRQLKKKPSDEALAKNVPEKGIHGYLPTLSNETNYWEGRHRQLLSTSERGTSFIVTLEMCVNLAVIEMAMTVWTGFNAINRGLDRHHPVWQDWNYGRREALGIIALSRLCREALPNQYPTDQAGPTQTISPSERRMDLIPDVSLRDIEMGGVLDARLHLSRERADDLLGPVNPAPEKAIWYRSLDGGLYLRREVNVDPMPLCAGLGSEANQANLQTLFPYLASK